MTRIELPKTVFITILFLCLIAGCVPKEQVILRSIDIHEVVPGKDGEPLLRADASFYNPNTTRMRLKRIAIDVMIDGKKAASVDQHLSALIKGNSDFSVPLEVQLNLKEIGLLDTILSLFGGKDYELQFTGKMKVTVGGFPINVPIKYQGKLKL